MLPWFLSLSKQDPWSVALSRSANISRCLATSINTHHHSNKPLHASAVKQPGAWNCTATVHIQLIVILHLLPSVAFYSYRVLP